jgi:hypothetical protein
VARYLCSILTIFEEQNLRAIQEKRVEPIIYRHRKMIVKMLDCQERLDVSEVKKRLQIHTIFF